MAKSYHYTRPRRGSMLTLAMVSALFLSAIAAVLMSAAQQSRVLTRRRAMLREVNNAVETTLNHGIAQIIARIGSDGQIGAEFLNPKTGGGLAAPDAAVYDAKGFSKVNPSMFTLMGGYAYSPMRSYVIPLSDPTTISDPFKGMAVTSRTLPLLVTATVPVHGGPSIVVRAKTDLVVRDAGLFGYAIFNNGPMTITPGNHMNIDGPVRCNGDFRYGCGGWLQFFGTVTTSGTVSANNQGGHVFVGSKDVNGDNRYNNASPSGYWKYDETSSTPFAPTATTAEMGWLWTKDAAGTFKLLDSTHPKWKDLATLVTNGGLQDKSHGVQPLVPAGLKSTTDGDKLNKPPLPSSDPGYDAGTEAAKYANKAGLYMVVEPDGRVAAFQNPADALQYKAVTGADSAAQRAARDAWQASNPGKLIDMPAHLVTGNDAAYATGTFFDKRQQKTINTVDVDVGALRSWVNGEAGYGAPQLKDGSAYSLNTPSEKGWNGTLYIDVEKPAGGWMPTKSGAAPTATNSLTGVRAFNASKVPNRSAATSAGAVGFTLATNTALYTVGNVNADGNMATGSSTMPDSGSVSSPGDETAVSLISDSLTTLSTKWQGTATTSATEVVPASSAPTAGTTTNPDGSSTKRTVTLRADGDYDVVTEVTRPTAKFHDPNLVNSSSGTPAANSNLEISAATLNGGGGLLENWDSRTTRTRGSAASMFKSLYDNPAPPAGNTYYSVPYREMGLSKIFSAGTYPPGTPIVRSCRRMGFRLLSAEAYEAELKSTITLANGSTVEKYPWK